MTHSHISLGMIPSLLLLFVLLINVHTTSGQNLNSNELEAIRWIGAQFKLNWNLSALTCQSISPDVICNTLNNASVTQIISTIQVPVSQAIPLPLPELQLPNLVKFNLVFNSNYSVGNDSLSVIELLDNPSNTKLAYIKLEGNANNPVTFSSNYPVYNPIVSIEIKKTYIYSNIPLSLFKLPNLTVVDFTNNIYAMFPSLNFDPAIQNFPKLTMLNLEYPPGQTIPYTTFSLSSRYPSLKSLMLLNVTVTLDISPNTRTLSFAGQTTTYTPNSLKMTVDISGWSFKSNLNTLRVVMQKDGSLNNATNVCAGSQSVVEIDKLNNVQFLKVTNKNGVELFGRFLPFALSDGRPSFSRNEIINTTDTTTLIGINLPQCQHCIIDPDFSVLVDQDTRDACADRSSSSNKWKIPVIVVVTVVGVAIIVAATSIIIKKKLRGRRMIDMIKMNKK
ncbi:hypothetical protein SAMD00019534_055660, partial [Acytostelium subglobosum LB1]|uniref:hypothetical protein n=1 Tax=Acytostelium subglobosum LB1 TaxID=1410327 RepID=UPI0006448AA1